MKRWLAPLAFGIAVAVISHIAVLYAAPGFIMDRAMAMLEERGIEKHAFTLGPRTLPQTQSVVRASPDLAYSACLYDFEDAPDGLIVRMAPTEGYSSLSFFDASTNNFATYRGGDGKGAFVEFMPPGSARNDASQLVSPTSTGIILIRRLAPTVADYSAITAVAMNDICGEIKVTVVDVEE